MALPTLVKTWMHNVNNAHTAQGTALADNRKVIRAIKNAMIGFGTNPWAVRYSCDSAAAGTAGDGVDRWAADTNLVWAAAGSAHSWVVLRQTGIATNFEVCISCEGANASGNALVVAVSFSAAFTGGSTTARPTATDEQVILNGSTPGFVGTSDLALRWGVMQSTDGQSTRIYAAVSGAVTMFAFFEKPANSTTGWSNPSLSSWVASSPNFINLTSTASSLVKMRNSSTNGNVCLMCEGDGQNLIPADTAFGNIANEIDSTWPIVPVAFAGTTVGLRGRHGTVNDLWFGSASVSTGDTYPNDSSNQFAQLGCLIVPWNGGAVNLT